MIITIITNDPPYGTERSFNALRLAMSLVKDEDVKLNLFLMADAVACAMKDQETPQGYYNLERMLKSVTGRGTVRACITCMKARGVKEEYFVEGVKSGDMALLADWVKTSDKVISF
ncbi:DsrE family protein [bacterium]|nr:DsrE family protein [bacterium]MBU1652601.1 DsrE family protein [bacterium]